MTDGEVGRWVVLVVRVPAAPSRHRVAVWRELRRIGALSLGQGTWAVPDVPAFTDGITRVIELAEGGEGEVVVLDATGRTETDTARLAEWFTSERQDEWAEFLADCGNFDVEIDKEIDKGKFTLAELEEEEQSLERLRRWHRELKACDVFGAPAAEADQQLKHCAERLEDYTEQVCPAPDVTTNQHTPRRRMEGPATVSVDTHPNPDGAGANRASPPARRATPEQRRGIHRLAARISAKVSW